MISLDVREEIVLLNERKRRPRCSIWTILCSSACGLGIAVIIILLILNEFEFSVKH